MVIPPPIRCDGVIEGRILYGPCVQTATPAPSHISTAVELSVNQRGIDFNGFGLLVPNFFWASMLAAPSVLRIRPDRQAYSMEPKLVIEH